MTQVVETLGYDRIASLASIHTFAPKRERFIFVRHGETEGNRTRVYQVPHIPLNEAGEAQAARAAESLSRTRIGKLVASPMARAWRTASLIAAEHKMHPEVDGSLSERFYTALWNTPIGEAAIDWSWDPDGCEPLATFVHRAAHSVMRTIGAMPCRCGLNALTVRGARRRLVANTRSARPRESGDPGPQTPAPMIPGFPLSRE